MCLLAGFGKPEGQTQAKDTDVTGLDEHSSAKPCCMPKAEKGVLPSFVAVRPGMPGDIGDLGLVNIPGGGGLVGTKSPYFAIDGEGPWWRVRVKPFRVMAATVTNVQFVAFAKATGYQTEA